MHLRVAHDAAFAHGLASRFELGLDQAGDFSAAFQMMLHRGGQRQGKRYKRNVCHQHINFVVYQRPVQQPGIGLFQRYHTWIRTQLPGQLIGAHVNSVDFGCAVLETAIRKTAGRRTDVYDLFVRQIKTENGYGPFQLQTAAGNIGQLLPQ